MTSIHPSTTSSSSSSSSSSLHTLWKSLNTAIEQENYTHVLQILQSQNHNASNLSEEDEENILQITILAHLYLNEYAEVIELLTNNENYKKLCMQNNILKFYLAYAYYRNKLPELALETLATVSSSSSPSSSSPSSSSSSVSTTLTASSLDQSPQFYHLKAQILYRLDKYTESALLYKEKFSADLFSDVEFVANVLATYVESHEFSNADQLIKEQQLDTQPPTYEIAYNVACKFTHQEDWENANKYLDLALKLCSETFQEDGEKVIAKESAVINLQKAYILQKTKQSQAAYDLYTEVLPHLSKESVNATVARENISILTKDFPELKIAASLNHSVDTKRKRKAAAASASAASSSTNTASTKSDTSTQLKISKKKKKRKTRYPKDFDPANPGPMPDPERWLPKWERSTYKKKKGRKFESMRGPQGSTSASPTATSSSSSQNANASSPTASQKSESKESKSSPPPTRTQPAAAGTAAAAAARKKQKNRKGRK